MMIPITNFISGPLDISPEVFDSYYVPKIIQGIEQGANFIFGDAQGVDLMTNKWFHAMNLSHSEFHLDNRITVYHMFTSPRSNPGNFATKGGFESDSQRDNEMTNNSTHDILWFRSPEEAKELYGDRYDPKRKTGTEKNYLRRFRILEKQKKEQKKEQRKITNDRDYEK